MAYRVFNKLDYTPIGIIIGEKQVSLPPKGWSEEFEVITPEMKIKEQGGILIIEEVAKSISIIKEKAKVENK